MTEVSTSYFLMKDGTVKSCGRNVFGELGLGHKNPVATPTTIPNLNNVKQILYGTYSATFLLKDGTAYLSGNNNYNNLTGRTDGELLVPTIMPKMINIKSMSGTGKHYLLTLKDGTQKIYGTNSFNNFGISGDSSKDLFDLPITKDVKKMVTSENQSALLFNDGTVMMAGYNRYGQLGLGNFTTSYDYFQKSRINNVKDVFLTNQGSTYFLLNDGTVYSCGSGLGGALGLGGASDTNIPTKINISNVKDIICNYYSVFFIKDDNSVWVCGYNENAKLGLGHANNVFIPVLNPNIKDYKKIAVNDKHCFFLTNDDKVYGFGNNLDGQLGLGSATSMQSKPVLIPIENVIDFETNNLISVLNFDIKNTTTFDYNKNEGNFLFDINITESSDKIKNYIIQEVNSDKPIFANEIDISEFPHTINERIPLTSLKEGINQVNVTVKTEAGDTATSKMYLIKGKNYYTWFDKLVKLKKSTNVKDNNLLLKLNSNGKVIPFTLNDNGEINLIKQQELIPVDKTSNNIQIGFVMEKTTELNSYGIAWL